MLRQNWFAFAAAVSLLALAAPAQAAAPHFTVWNQVASGCVLDTASAQAGLAVTNGISSDVRFAGTKTGMIRMICPVTQLNDPNALPQTLFVTYTDPDGFGSTCQVRAHLLRTSMDSSGLGNTIVSIDSNGSNVSTRTQGQAFFSEVIDFDSSYYWVDIELIRTGTSCNPSVNGVRLVDLP